MGTKVLSNGEMRGGVVYVIGEYNVKKGLAIIFIENCSVYLYSIPLGKLKTVMKIS